MMNPYLLNNAALLAVMGERLCIKPDPGSLEQHNIYALELAGRKGNNLPTHFGIAPDLP